MKACPRITALAVRWVFSPRIGLSRAFSRAMVALDPVDLVLAGDVQRGRNQLLDHVRQSRGTVGDDLSRDTWTDNAAVKNVLAEAMSRRCDTYTSMTWPRWSTAR